jgi:hypothetical protein
MYNKKTIPLNKKVDLEMKLVKKIIVMLIGFLAWIREGTRRLPDSELKRLAVMPAAHLVEEVVEIGIAVVMYSIVMGSIAIPQFMTVSTAGWPTYAALLWVLIPTVAIIVFIQAMFYHVKYGVYPAYMGPR